MVRCIIVVVLILIVNNEAAKILAYFPTPSHSHHVVFRPIVKELAKRGHDVTTITIHPEFPKGQTPANLTEIDVREGEGLSIEARRQISQNVLGADEVSQISFLYKLLNPIIERQLKRDDVQKIVKNNKTTYDLIILECWMRQTLVLTHFFKAPVIMLCSFGGIFDMSAIAGPMNPVFFPNILHRRVNNLSLLEKAKLLYTEYQLTRFYNDHEKIENAMLKRVFGEGLPDLNNLYVNVDLLMLGVSPIIQGNYPVPPNVIHIGGMELNDSKPLSADLKTWLDGSTNGVVYVSFGSNIQSSQLPRKSLEVLIKVLSAIPYDVLWKFDDDKLPIESKNIKISQWLPQASLLKHPKVKLFITQAGLQSTDEAIAAGVPMIAFPALADQFSNAETYERLGIGVKLDIFTVTEEELTAAIETVTGNESYRSNVRKLRRRMQDQPQSSLERAVWWTEYVLRHGGASHLRSPAANISWTEYLQLELLAYIALFVILVVCTVIYTVLFIWKFVFKSISKTKKE